MYVVCRCGDLATYREVREQIHHSIVEVPHGSDGLIAENIVWCRSGRIGYAIGSLTRSALRDRVGTLPCSGL